MSNSIEALDLPLQFFAVGTVIGMTAALIRYFQTGDNDHWPRYVAMASTGFFYYGVAQTIVRALF